MKEYIYIFSTQKQEIEHETVRGCVLLSRSVYKISLELDGTGSCSNGRLAHFSLAAMVQDLSGVFHDQQPLQ